MRQRALNQAAIARMVAEEEGGREGNVVSMAVRSARARISILDLGRPGYAAKRKEKWVGRRVV